MTLTRDRVVDTAVGILRRFGLADLSMRRLARELDVQPGAIYWHVASKQALLVEVADRLLADVTNADRPDRLDSDDAAADLRAHVLHVYDALLPVPDAADVVELAYALDPDAVPALLMIRRLLERLAEPTQVEVAVDLLVHHILGSVAAHQVRAHGEHPQRREPPLEAGVDIVLRGLST